MIKENRGHETKRVPELGGQERKGPGKFGQLKEDRFGGRATSKSLNRNIKQGNNSLTRMVTKFPRHLVWTILTKRKKEEAMSKERMEVKGVQEEVQSTVTYFHERLQER